MKRCLYVILLIGLMYSAPRAEEPILSGSAVKELGGDPPPAPMGYPNTTALFAAIKLGFVKLVDRDSPLPENVEWRKDIEYGKVGDRSLKLDLYVPKERTGKLPLLIFIHGGGWKGGDKADYRIYTQVFAQKGYIVASVGYRLTGEAKFPACVNDVKCAVRYLRKNADELGIDADRIGVVGGSAGGHLAMMTGYSSDVPELEGDGGNAGVSSHVKAVVNIYGPYNLDDDFVRTNEGANKLVESFLGKPVAEAGDLLDKASPAHYHDPKDPPTLILHGTIDDIVPVDQSDQLARKLTEFKTPYVYDRIPGWPHTMDLAKDINVRSTWMMEHFFARFLKDETPTAK
jgi:acetyl esterase/lipase